MVSKPRFSLRAVAPALALLAVSTSAASAQPAADYCALLTKEDVEAALKTEVTKVTSAPLKEIPATRR